MSLLPSQLSVAEFATLFDALPVGIVVTDIASQRVVSVNEAVLRLLQCSRDALVGHNSEQALLLSPEQRGALLEEFAKRGCVRDHVVTRAQRGGEVQVLSVNVDRLQLGGQPMMVSTLRDVTDAHRERQNSLLSEGRFRALFEQAAIGVAHCDEATGLFLETNELVCTMLGYSLEELQKRSWRSLTHPGDLERDVSEVRRHLAQVTPYRTEKRYVRKDGTTLWARVTVTPLLHQVAGRPTVLVLIEDVTEHRRVTDQLHQAQKLESIGRLAGGVAHDFNNLLTVILACTENVELDLADGRMPDVEDVKELALAGQRAQELTRQLLSFSRRQYTEPVDLSLNEVVERSVPMLRRLVGEDVRVESALAREPWRTWADRGQLEQVLMNLAVNARDAMPRGGTLRLETSNRTLAPGHAHAGEWAVLSVIDTGEGLTDEVKAHLFEPFFTTKEKGKGTGLGLATVYGIVTGAGGFLEVCSRRSEGARFDVFLPRTARVAPPAMPPTEAPQKGSEVVLVVEDEERVREVTMKALRGAGYEVHGAPGPHEALALDGALLRRLHLLVTDVVMPDLDGKALAERLRVANPSLRVLLVSGYLREAILERGALAPGTEFLPKPYTAAALLARVRAVLDA